MRLPNPSRTAQPKPSKAERLEKRRQTLALLPPDERELHESGSVYFITAFDVPDYEGRSLRYMTRDLVRATLDEANVRGVTA